MRGSLGDGAASVRPPHLLGARFSQRRAWLRLPEAGAGGRAAPPPAGRDLAGADRAPCLRLPASKSPAPRQFSGLYCSLTWGRRSPSLSEVPKSGASPLAWHNYPVPNFSFLFFLFIILLTAKTSEAWILCCSFAGLPIQNYLHVNKCTCQFGHHK